MTKPQQSTWKHLTRSHLGDFSDLHKDSDASCKMDNAAITKTRRSDISWCSQRQEQANSQTDIRII